ncbi:hypothetical protein NKH28_31420 [Mesorhizobium sp. M1227]|uniref:ORC-CDC6 family AAA ATPase n=1 Tax=Mesorhizobium sp. M1227 TaxID=2957071 RepID=UPI00333A46BF
MTALQDQSNSLQSLFGSFRAEWLQEKLFSLFSEPAYFPSLKDHRPCVLIGGRGTGKTTALRCMSYEGQFALAGDRFADVAASDFVGLYHKVNTTRVSAFEGSIRTPEQWRRIFSHYTNVEICEMLLAAFDWHKSQSASSETIDVKTCRRVAASFGYDNVSSEDGLRSCVSDALAAIERCINNVSLPEPTLSLLQVPIDLLASGLRTTKLLDGKIFYVILDEYENYLDYQQQIMNTLVKHSSGSYVFKIGVRELGWRVRSTLNPNEYLVNPADYELINIENRLSETFPKLAREVCEARLAAWDSSFTEHHASLDRLLPALSQDREADMLGVDKHLEGFREYLLSRKNDAVLSLKNLEMYVFLSLNEGNFDAALKELILYAAGETQQKDRYHNYKYAYLFSITGKGAEISKYYCGTDVFSLISRNNLRFFLQLVTESLARHLAGGNPVNSSISFEDQTKAARQVGLQYLTELEGVTVRGVQLVKLLLGLGRLFQILSMNPAGSAPECNQFQLRSNRTLSHETIEFASALLRDGVMHLALVRSPGTKLATDSDIREWDYSPHPIFAPFFNFSHRRKRKLDLTEQDIADMVRQPQVTIKRLLRERSSLAEQQMPTQLMLFDDYFGASNA